MLTLKPLISLTEKRSPEALARIDALASKTLWWFALLAPFGQLAFGPFLLNREYKQKGRSDKERKMLVGQEFVSQGINCAVHAISFLAVGLSVQAFLHKKVPDTAISAKAKEDLKTLASSFGSFMGMSLLRPWVSGKVINNWMARQQQNDKESSVPKAQFGNNATFPTTFPAPHSPALVLNVTSVSPTLMKQPASPGVPSIGTAGTGMPLPYSPQLEAQRYPRVSHLPAAQPSMTVMGL